VPNYRTDVTAHIEEQNMELNNVVVSDIIMAGLVEYVSHLEQAVSVLKPTGHYHVENDTWFCCPACEDYCGEDDSKDCKCGYISKLHMLKDLEDHKRRLYGDKT
jgi:hypothetical protein